MNAANSTPKSKHRVSDSQFYDAARYVAENQLINISTRRIPYRDFVWALMFRGHEKQDIDAAVALARELVSKSDKFSEDSFLSDVNSFNADKVHPNSGGWIVTLAKKHGWQKPKASAEEQVEKYGDRWHDADPSKPSPYFIEHKGYKKNPNGVRVEADGTTIIRTVNFEGECGYILIYFDSGNQKWVKRSVTPSKGFFFCDFDPIGYSAKTFESYLLEQPEGVSEYREPYRTTRVVLTESVANKAAIDASIRAEGRGSLLDSRDWAVIAVGSCNNIDDVVDGIRARRPDIVVCIVPDRENSGEGLRSVAEVCKTYPEILVADPGKGAEDVTVDADDFYREHGSGALVALIDAAKPMTAEEIERVTSKEHSSPAKRGRGRPRKADGEFIPAPQKRRATSYSGILEYLENSGVDIRFDEFTHQTLIRNDTGMLVEVTDDTIFDLTCVVEQQFSRVKLGDVEAAVRRLGSRNRFDSATTWLESLTWDGVPRVDRFFFEYCSVPEVGPRLTRSLRYTEGDDERETADYARACARYWWSAMAGRVLQPGLKCDMTVVLVDEQGAKKSSLAQAVAPFPDAYCTVDLSASDAENARKLTAGKIVVELDELRGLATRDAEHIKSFLTQTFDDYRPLFGKRYIRVQRRFVFFGSANDRRFLRDSTGSRRFLPLTIGQCDVEKARRDCEQLWAEARELFRREGLQYAEAERRAKGQHDKFEYRDAWHDAIAEYCGDRLHVKTADAAQQALKLEIGQVTDAVTKRISAIFQNLGYRNSRRRIGGQRVYGFFKEVYS